MSAVMGATVPIKKKPRSEPKKLGTLTQDEAFWHPIILAFFAVVLLFSALARWTSVAVSAFVTLAIVMVGICCAALATLTAASRKQQALEGLRSAITSKDHTSIRVAICRAAVIGVTVTEASALKEVRLALSGAGAKLSCASKASSARDLRQRVVPHECEQRSVGCEVHATGLTFVAGALAAAPEPACISAAPADVAPEVSAGAVPSVWPVPVELGKQAGSKRVQEVWFDGDASPWILL